MTDAKRPFLSIFMRWPGSLCWLLNALAVGLLCWWLGAIGGLAWYLLMPAFVALAFIDLFTTVWLGITILTTLFIYSSVGSSGVPVSPFIWEPQAWQGLREMRGLEMTEYEWFHWWPFKWLVALLCMNMAITTIRRIPLRAVHLGAWIIHSGVITLVIGCVIYFGTKVEGDVAVSRCRVVIEQASGPPLSMVATPGNSMSAGESTFTITSIDPAWELMSGDDKGTRAYSVSVSVQRGEEMFIRQMIDGFPQYTEDVVRTDDPAQPMARSKKVLGRALVDESLTMRLDRDPRDRFFVTQSSAIYLRELRRMGEQLVPMTPWIERPIDDMPRYNDYVASHGDVWGSDPRTLSPLTIGVPAAHQSDPLSGTMRIDSYLRYALPDTRVLPGGAAKWPVAWATLRQGDARSQELQMHASDPSASTADPALMTFRWAASTADRDAFRKSLLPLVTARVGDTTFELEVDVTSEEDGALEFTTLVDTPYAIRVQRVDDGLNIGGQSISLARVEIRRGEVTWLRWVFDDPTINRDISEDGDHDAPRLIDEEIVMAYRPAAAPITLVGGPADDDLELVMDLGEGPTNSPVVLGEQIAITEGITLSIDRVEPYTRSETRPAIVPLQQRDPDAQNMFSMIKVTLAGAAAPAWLPYHHYPFEGPSEVIRRYRYEPTIVVLDDGRAMELLYSRRSAPLPTAVVLEEFTVDTHVGGFTGNTSSILNWRSNIRFLGEDHGAIVSVNDPQRYGEYWFFQSQWDPPDAPRFTGDPGSRGLNYTVLGVGNRRGVFVMLSGVCITVAGMMWAFYVKPVIKRRRQSRVQDGLVA